MSNDLQNNSQSQNIGTMLLQADRWGRIEDWVKAGVPIRGIAKAFLEEDDEIRSYYEQKGSTNPQKTLSNVIAYHVREQISVAERIGFKQFRYFFEREVGDMNVLQELKQLVDLQKERTGKAVELERKIGIVTAQTGKEMTILTNILGTLGKLMLSAGLNLREEEKCVTDSKTETQNGNIAMYILIVLLEQHGYSRTKAIEVATGIPDITGKANDEPDPLGVKKISLIDMMRLSENMEREQVQSDS